MAQGYDNLLAEGKIGSMILKNRMVVAAMGANFGELDGSSGERVKAYHEAQAAGGVGLIISGACGVAYPVGCVQPNQIAISDDKYIPGLKAVVDAIHAKGGKFAVQLHHGGLVAAEDTVHGRPLWCPSIPGPMEGDFVDGFLMEELAAFAGGGMPTFKVVDKDDIALVVRQFAQGARRAIQAGCDAVEVHGGHGYILSSFLSPKTNQRTDEYGGSDENRARFICEVVRAVRAEVGPDYPVIVKIDSREVGKKGGITVEHAKVTAKLLEEAGADAITVSSYHDGGQGKLHSASNIPHEENANVAAAIAIKNVVSIPVITSGRVELEVGNEAIARGEYDFLMMGRKLLADPDLPNKLAQGRVTDIRPCVYCYTCVSAIYKVESMLCAVNPELGVEYQRPTLITSDKKHTVIVGGGPGGMEAARRLALAGQKVTLLEKGPVLGGTLRFAGLAYEPNQRLLKWLIKEVNSLDIDIRLNTEATPALIKSLSPDAVITAVGARRFMPELPGNDHKHVYSGEDMRRLMLGDFDSSLTAKTSLLTRSLVAMGNLTGLIRNLDLVRRISHFWMPLGKRVVIVGGDLVGLELAEYLIDRGREVTVLHEEPRMGAGLTLVRRLRLLAELREHGALLERGVSAVAIEGRSVRYTDEKKNAKSVDADSVIVARGAEANGSVAESLSGLGIPVIEIGDSTGVGYIEGAMRDAMHAVDELIAA